MGRPGLQRPQVLPRGGRHSGLAVWRCRSFGAELGSTAERVVLPICFAKCGQVCSRANLPRSTAPSHILSWPGSPGSGTLCSVVALEPMTTTTSPCPKGAPSSHPHLETSERSAADTREATAAAIAAQETPRVSRTRSPWLGVPFPLTLAVLLAPPRLEGAASSRPQRASRHLAGAGPYLGPQDRSPRCGSQDDPPRRYRQQSYPRWQREARAGSPGRFLENLSGAEQRLWLSDPRSCSGLPRAHLWSRSLK